MQVCVIENHTGEGIFPLFTKGMQVKKIMECREFVHWLSCEIEGNSTYVPKLYLDNNECLLRDYNPTELLVQKGEIVQVALIVHEWLYVQKGPLQGWLPAYKVVSCG